MTTDDLRFRGIAADIEGGGSHNSSTAELANIRHSQVSTCRRIASQVPRVNTFRSV
jgi:hypothetical protein